MSETKAEASPEAGLGTVVSKNVKGDKTSASSSEIQGRKAVPNFSRPSVGADGARRIRVWFQNRRTGETEVGKIMYRNPELDNSLLSAIISCWSLGSHPEVLDFLLATDDMGRAVVTQKELYSYSYRQVQNATEAYVKNALEEGKEEAKQESSGG